MEPQDITGLLIAWRQGDQDALTALMPAVYRRLKRMAIGYLRFERDAHTFQPTDLVHEAYLRLIELKRVSWKDRAHFFAMSSTLMRRILVEHARQRDSAKRGKDAVKVPLDAARDLHIAPAAELLALDDALRDLGEQDEVMAKIVEMRYFGGLNRDEIAEVLGISSASVTRSWRRARAWLQRHLAEGERGETGHES